MSKFQKEFDIKKGDIATIRSQGLTITGEVNYAFYDESRGWDITLVTNKGSIHSWKQIYDGGEIINVWFVANIQKKLDVVNKDIESLEYKLTEDYSYDDNELYLISNDILTELLSASFEFELPSEDELKNVGVFKLIQEDNQNKEINREEVEKAIKLLRKVYDSINKRFTEYKKNP